MRLKKKLLIIATVMIPLVAFGTIQELLDGDHIGVKSTDKLGFYGKTPVVRPANTVTAFGALQTLGLIASGGSDTTTTTANNPIQHVTVNIASADILALYSAPKLLVAAPTAGHTIALSKAIFKMVKTSTGYTTGGGPAIIQYDSTVNGAGVNAADSTIAATTITGTSVTTLTTRNGAVITNDSTPISGKGLYLSATTGDFTVGTGTAVMDVWYYVN